MAFGVFAELRAGADFDFDGSDGRVLRDFLDALVAGPQSAAQEATLRANGAELGMARRLRDRLSRLIDEEIEKGNRR